jgi:hypothetical protein
VDLLTSARRIWRLAWRQETQETRVRDGKLLHDKSVDIGVEGMDDVSMEAADDADMEGEEVSVADGNAAAALAGLLC